MEINTRECNSEPWELVTEGVSECLAQEAKTGETKATHNLPGLENVVCLMCLNDWRTESFYSFLLLCSCVTVQP